MRGVLTHHRQRDVGRSRRIVKHRLVRHPEFVVHALGVAGVGVSVVHGEAAVQLLTNLGLSRSSTKSSKSIIMLVIARPLFLRANC